MEPVTGKEAASRVHGIINPKYQVHGYAVDFTVKKIYSVDPVGQVDFGGSEYKPAGRLALVTQRRHPEDKYEWWDLSRGCYFVEFNETLELAPNEIAVLEPEERLLRAGASHAPMFLRGHIAPVEALLDVPALRVEMKQNARISRLRVFRFGGAGVYIEAIPAPAPEKPKKAPKKSGRR